MAITSCATKAVLTYKSNLIDAGIIAHHRIGKLRPWTPVSRKSFKRRLYVASNALLVLDSPQNAIRREVGIGNVHAAFDRWVLNGRVYATLDGKPSFLKWLKPRSRELWEIRITEPNAQGRAIGKFLAPDTFLVLDIRTRKFLGAYGSPNWRTVMDDADLHWSQLFPQTGPFVGATIYDYVTENVDFFEI